MSIRSPAVVIVGGGLSGLVAAVQLGREGVPVVLFEHADGVGGRARSHCQAGFELNLGPHRLFDGGAAVIALRRLGLSLPTAPRGPNGGFAIWRGAKHTLPTGCFSLLVTALFGPTAKLELARFLARVPAVDVATLHDVPVREWLRTELEDPRVIEFALALVRFTTYANDPERQSAAGAVEQLKLKLGGPIVYLQSGLGTVVQALRAAAVAAHATIQMGRSVCGLNIANGQAVGVSLEGGQVVDCRGVIVATGPQQAEEVLGTALMPSAALIPVRIATLDVVLQRLPMKQSLFAIGVDDPVCFSVDSVIAPLPRCVGAVVHLARYLGPAEDNHGDVEGALEQVLDLVQAGWRDLVVFRRFAPNVVVSSALVTATGGGTKGRPAGGVEGLDNVFLAGDWVGPTGQLADASIASGLRAARAVTNLTPRRGI
jgi:glycine/D-amino acid oxidase-like deaminating enzyme